MTPVRIAIHGAAGRMGKRLVALAAEDPEIQVVAALESSNHPRLGEDAGTVAGAGPLGVPLASQLQGESEVIIDFSLPEAFDSLLETALQQRIPLVVATTGLSGQQRERLEAAAAQIPVLSAPNMSLAVNLAMKLAQAVAQVCRGRDVDVEIIERHHRFKEDAPSGTALRFGQIIASVMGQGQHRHGRQGRPGPRPRDEIAYHAIRAGDNPGEHTIVFASLGEVLELTVRATNRDCYAQGALAAAKFLAAQSPGLYDMTHVLGL
ncbi:MAG TPA: 4-hydroxy-tetrahydrodipicolinate reductase [Planctomycetaceae bacterium]|nr:4-hydroxy-tetrahydrodipicolinate reductase [Planctomycetaceae bacterium]HIQ21469.1 4-hydroxy-tetrahydrodipicolinate reductase [Planctomycetota bacterium]